MAGFGGAILKGLGGLKKGMSKFEEGRSKVEDVLHPGEDDKKKKKKKLGESLLPKPPDPTKFGQ